MKTETVEEFKARGGKITVCKPSTYSIEASVYITPGNTLLSLLEGKDMFTKKRKSKQQSRCLDTSQRSK